MKTRVRFFAVLVVSFAWQILSSSGASARPAFLQVLTSQYPQQEAVLSERGCANCHVSSTDFKLNPFGRQIAQAMLDASEKKLTPAILQKVETLDANGDGVSNLDEIKAGKAPGEPRPGAAVTAKVDSKLVDKPAALTSTAEHKTAAPEDSLTTDKTKNKSSASVAAKPMTKSTALTNSAASSGKIANKPDSETMATKEKAPAVAPSTQKAKPQVEQASDMVKVEPPSKAPPVEDSKPVIPKNAYHPAIVHFPIALFLAGLLLDLIGILGKREALLLAGWYNIVLAAVSSAAAIITGFGAMIFQKLPFTGLIPQHMLTAVISALIMWMMVALRVHRHNEMGKPIRLLYTVLAIAALVLISYSGHLGGAYVYGE